jgi:predicted dienelactone hydrolase
VQQLLQNWRVKKRIFGKSVLGNQPMPVTTNSRGLFPSLPREHFRRKRAIRKIGNASFILIFSMVVAYVITRPVGGRGYTPAKPAKIVAVPELASSSGAPSTNLMEGYEAQDGPFAVTEVSDIALHDGKRNKDLHVRVFFPTNAGKFPVIVFSHGAGGSQSCCESLTRHWASYGYVTLQPTHEDSAVQRRNEGEENIRFLQAVRDALKNQSLWESRPQDVSFVLDSLQVLERRVPGLAGKLDKDRIGVAGHSMGAYTAEAIAGARVDLSNHPAQSFADSRVKAVVCLSPQGPGQFGLTEHSFDQMGLAFLGVTGSLDSLGPVASPAWHKTPFEQSEPNNKFHLFIKGANHMSFISARTALPASSVQGETILGYTNSATMAFWDAYLKDDAKGKKYLASDALEQASHGGAILSRR